jgi:hypothetical protein
MALNTNSVHFDRFTSTAYIDYHFLCNSELSRGDSMVQLRAEKKASESNDRHEDDRKYHFLKPWGIRWRIRCQEAAHTHTPSSTASIMFSAAILTTNRTELQMLDDIRFERFYRRFHRLMPVIMEAWKRDRIENRSLRRTLDEVEVILREGQPVNEEEELLEENAPKKAKRSEE